MTEIEVTAVVVFAAVASLTVLVLTIAGQRPSRLDLRLQGLSGAPGAAAAAGVGGLARSALPKVGQVLLPAKEEDRTRLQTRLTHAGYYGRQALPVYLGVKLVLMVGPVVAGALAVLTGLVSLPTGLAAGCLLGAFGLLAPGFWLDARKRARQRDLRRAIPDALDVMVVCLEGGASLPSAINRVAGELRDAHPRLAVELAIVQREIQLGRTAGEALRTFAGRSDLEEVRGLAAVIVQAEKFGASLVRALRVHADTLRNKRVMYAEEMAQKAVVKLLFPTVLFILPALFVAILGPNVILLVEVFRGVEF